MSKINFLFSCKGRSYWSMALSLVLCLGLAMPLQSQIFSNPTDVALLPDNGCVDDSNTGTGLGGTTSTIAVSGVGTLDWSSSDVIDSVTIGFSHTWRSDIQVALVAPDGTVLRLANNVNTSGDNFFARFTDNSVVLVNAAAACGTSSNCVSPSGPLVQPQFGTLQSAFDGKNADGTWTLRMCDRAASDFGTLNYWSIAFPVVPPDITCPGTATVACGGDTSPAATGEATATGGCGPATISSTDVFTSTCGGAGFITRTWTATACGASSSCPQIINITDNVGPMITCPAPATVSCDESTDPAVTGTVTASAAPNSVSWPDANTGLVGTAVATVSGIPAGAVITDVNVTMQIDHSWVADLNITLVSPSGTTVNFLDNPCGTSNSDNLNATFDSQGAAFLCTSGVVGDVGNPNDCSSDYLLGSAINGTMQPQLGSFDDFNGSTMGNGAWELEVTDFEVGDGGCLIGYSVQVSWEIPGAVGTGTGVATATDACGLSTVIFSDASTQGTGCSEFNYVITRTWTATDGCGNPSTCNQTITVEDTSPPTGIVCPPTASVGCDQPNAPNVLNSFPTGSGDNCAANNQLLFTHTDMPQAMVGACAGIIARTWTVEDPCGNEGPTCVQTILLLDNTPPTIVTCPADATVDCGNGPVGTGAATATDNCTAVTITSSDAVAQGNVPSESVVTRTWIATDACTNANMSCVQIITVSDLVDPTITCPAPVTIECDASQAPMHTGTATAIDNCTPVPDISITSTDAIIPGNCPHNYTIERTWVATDGVAKTDDCVQTITVEDTTDPVMQCATSTSITPNANATYSFSQAEIDALAAGTTDNCGSVTFTASPSFFTCAEEGTNTMTITGTDQCGNSSTCAVIVTVQPYLVLVSATATAESCLGAGDGTITIMATSLGGTLGYSIDGGTNFSFINTFDKLGPGTYNVVVKVFGVPAICEKTAVVTVAAGPAPTVWYRDVDGDGYHNGQTLESCTQPAGYVATAQPGDCNDNDPLQFPGQTWYQDVDNDGYYSGKTLVSCERPAGYKAASELTNNAIDCKDNNASINPGATEVCNGIDDNCNGTKDEGLSGFTYVGNVSFPNQTALNNWPACYSVIQGSVTISGSTNVNLGPLSNITSITGNLIITGNSNLTSLNGLGNLTSVGGTLRINYNFKLNDCCAIDALLTNNGVGGPITIFFNKVGCNSATEIMNGCVTFAPPATGLLAPTGHIATSEISLFPNPAGDEVNIQVLRTAPQATLRILDMFGRTVWLQELEEGVQYVTVDLAGAKLENGMYLVSLSENSEVITKPLVINRK